MKYCRIITAAVLAISISAFAQWTPKPQKITLPKPATPPAKPSPPKTVPMPKPSERMLDSGHVQEASR